MASGSQTKSGICALLPVAPINMSSTTQSTQAGAVSYVRPRANSMIGPKSSVRRLSKMMNIAKKKAKSPTRLTMNALLAAALLLRSVYQKPISRYEHSPTPSQPEKEDAAGYRPAPG